MGQKFRTLSRYLQSEFTSFGISRYPYETPNKRCIGSKKYICETVVLRGNWACAQSIGKLDALSNRTVVPPVRIAKRIAGTREFVVAYSQCLALAAPAQGVALVKTEYRSDAEKSALLAIGGPLKACMPEGVAYSINIRDVRNHLADALYRMSGEPNA